MHDHPLNDSRIGRLIELALMEDIGMGDITSEATVDEERTAAATFLCKQDGVIAGLDVAALVFQYCDHGITLTAAVSDGSAVAAGTTVGTVDGNARAILRGERTALNFLQRMSGIATETRRYVEAVKGTRARITDTRKTVPGLRVLDKWAVRLGGGTNHRFGLDDMVLIKDNHIAAAGGIRNALLECKSYLLRQEIGLRIEVETRTLEEVREALDAGGIDRIMLDNVAPATMRRAVELIAGRVEVEASGGITLENVRDVAATGVDLISIGALTHSVRALDISLEFPALH
jgi:nicotinate-nucleotide pyrophosphorylase (carboxylating)